MIFAERKDIDWISGWDEMRSYSFATEKKVHRFCGTCGSSVCMDFLGLWKAAGDVIGINVSFFSWRLLSCLLYVAAQPCVAGLVMIMRTGSFLVTDLM